MNWGQTIEHVVVLMLENRSFDHVLGSLRLKEGRTDLEGLRASDGCTDGKGRRCLVTPMQSNRAGSWPYGPPHHWRDIAVQMSLKTPNDMQGFVVSHAKRYPKDQRPDDVVRYLTRGQQAATYFLADHYTICDHWFSPLPADTIPNRLYSVCGQAGGLRSDPKGLLSIPSIFDRLTKKGDYKIYAGTLPLLFVLKGLPPAVRSLDGLGTIRDFLEDAERGALPKLSWIEPFYFWGDDDRLASRFPGDPNDDHPPSHTSRGQGLIARIYNAIAKHPELRKNTCFILTYDEHGGFYDHVPPPAIFEDERVPADQFGRRGPRVPAIIASPHSPRQVFQATMDHCSILKMACAWFGIVPFTPRIKSTRIASVADSVREVNVPLEPRPDLLVDGLEDPDAPFTIPADAGFARSGLGGVIRMIHDVISEDFSDLMGLL